jgi:hypothetical protein
MSIFRKRHYSWLSSHLRDETYKIKNQGNPHPELIIFENFARNLANALHAEHPSFDVEQFLIDSDLAEANKIKRSNWDFTVLPERADH